MKIKAYLPAAVIAALSLSACQDSYENIDNSIFAPTLDTETTINVKPTTSTATGYVEASMAMAMPTDVKVTFVADESKVDVYNGTYSTDYKMLPAEYYSIPQPEAVIPSGGNTTGKVAVEFKNLGTLDVTTTYVLPVTMTSEYASLSNDTYYFVIKESALVTVTADMTENYAVFARGNQAPELGAMEQITVEALLYPLEFPNMLATVMGIEGSFLVRIGDAGIPANQLQLATSNGNVTDPAWTFDTNKWTFLTLTYNTADGECRVYFNGVLKGSVQTGNYRSPVNWDTASGDITDGPRGFYVGYAYDNNRYFKGYMSELRVWNRILGEDEIKSPNHFYEVSPESEGLVSYWKMDEGTGDAIHDYANGYDLKCQKAPQWIPVYLPAK
ncbi:MAG: DUF1735 and LamG domain-containing protein [Muribaculaceae bacterium]|nr:DUF1735 and LamG domain-containing protein [Muribaculaceae bacterium]MDE6130322.1 DUF1735 and LamG domain-containing protein [Muribaculaceae bacterium]